MAELGRFTEVLWLLTVAAETALLFLLVRTGAARQYPALCAYLCMTIGQSALLFATYETWGFASTISWRIAWATQALVLMARAWAVTEVCRKILRRFQGVWALARRILLICGFVVVGFAASVGYHERRLLLTTGEAALELATAAIVVLLLLFTRYYDIEVVSPVRWLAVGFCSYSCVSVLNDMVLVHWLIHYAPLWNAATMLVFFACLTGWTWAFRHWKPIPQEAATIDGETYGLVIPEMNWQLRALNEQLIRLWRVEAPGA